MQYKFFTIPIDAENLAMLEEELNSFLRGHRILGIQRELICNDRLSCWCCCVEYVEGARPQESDKTPREKVDYRNVLNEKDFEKFRILRECRKQLAQMDNMPAYAIFLDEQLAEMAKADELSEEIMKSINGIGEKKMEKFAARFLALVREKNNEAGRQSILENSGN